MSTESGPNPCCSWQVGTRIDGIVRSRSLSRLMTANALSHPPSATSRALTGDGWVIVPATFLMSHSRSRVERVAVPDQQVHRGRDGVAFGAVPHPLLFVGQEHQLSSGGVREPEVRAEPRPQQPDVDRVHAGQRVKIDAPERLG